MQHVKNLVVYSLGLLDARLYSVTADRGASREKIQRSSHIIGATELASRNRLQLLGTTGIQIAGKLIEFSRN